MRTDLHFTDVHLAIDELKATGQFREMDLDTDQDEHSIEMHLPYVRKVFEGCVRALDLTICYIQHPTLTTPPSQDIEIVPILVGAIDKDKEAYFGKLLAPFLAREDTFCVVSSDFCHWSVFCVS